MLQSMKLATEFLVEGGTFVTKIVSSIIPVGRTQLLISRSVPKQGLQQLAMGLQPAFQQGRGDQASFVA